MENRQKFLPLSVIMPSVLSDADTLLRNAGLFFRYLPIKNIYVAAPENVREKITLFNDSRIIFVNENEFSDVKRIREIYSSRTSIDPGRAGWYVQQFIKMGFCNFTDDAYYLIWDSDTIPLKPAEFFDSEGRPYFDMKTEYNPPYFATMGRILPGVKKAVRKSFISEHMVIRSGYMREMIREIEANNTLEGGNFQEKIMNAVDAGDLHESGFSEFETYGNYVMARHEGSYLLRAWRSLGHGGRFYSDISQVSPDVLRWISSGYDAATFEKFSERSRIARLVRTKTFQKIFPPGILEFFR